VMRLYDVIFCIQHYRGIEADKREARKSLRPFDRFKDICEITFVLDLLECF
jgi:hypothetical protein